MKPLFRFLLVLALAAVTWSAPTEASPTWRLVAPITLGGVNLATRSFEAGALAGGIGIGLDVGSGWYAVTPMVAASAGIASEAPSGASIAALLGFAGYGVVGTMVRLQPGLQQWYLLAGLDVVKLATGPAKP